ncbi:ankyrin repeat domain-containing protein [Aquabacterium sp. OR-4]|uniref:ankyrin repeat domain-containing protein n=1 Tax=Aquabacterium sp. OR-4 TaxID=2978127 RepID=UPI0021B46B3A|nr:ankyrin repeat domain-containing protein [Aquabacterium sp. OR-4]MDT7834658.1 ankyrin repeat domain-containing protein [Aquabacterium sp. OR-4]
MFRTSMRLMAALSLALASLGAHAGAYDDFFRALQTDNASGVAALLQRGFDPNSRDPQGQTALYAALRDGSGQVLALLMAHPQTQIDLANVAGETPLMIAALKGRLDAARQLLDRGATLERDGWTPLHYAASGPEATLVKLLLDRGARPDARSPNGSTPLMMAARNGTEAAVALLLARGADPALRNEQNLVAADFARQAGREKLALSLSQPAR